MNAAEPMVAGSSGVDASHARAHTHTEKCRLKSVRNLVVSSLVVAVKEKHFPRFIVVFVFAVFSVACHVCGMRSFFDCCSISAWFFGF
jgi:hypothetical protein